MRNTELFYRVFLLFYIVIYLVVLYIYNIKSFKKKYGIDPKVVNKSDKLMYKLERWRDLVFVVIMLNIIVFSLFPNLYFLFGPIAYLDIETLKRIGVLVLICSLILTRVAQIQLKEAWRIGIDQSETKGTLVITGIYSKSRNPIALGMFLGTLGFFLIIPNMTTFSIIILVHLIFSIRIILEEDHLYKLHGDKYENYRNTTRKWI